MSTAWHHLRMTPHEGNRVEMASTASTQNYDICGLVQDCGNSIAYSLELLQSCTKPNTYTEVT